MKKNDRRKASSPAHSREAKSTLKWREKGRHFFPDLSTHRKASFSSDWEAAFDTPKKRPTVDRRKDLL